MLELEYFTWWPCKKIIPLQIWRQVLTTAQEMSIRYANWRICNGGFCLVETPGSNGMNIFIFKSHTYHTIPHHTITYNYIPRHTITYITCHYSPLQGCVAMMFDAGKYPDNSFLTFWICFFDTRNIFWSWSRALTCTEAVRCCTGRWHFGNNLKTIYTHCIIKHCCIHWGVLLGVVTTYFGVRLDDVKLWPAAAISQQLHFLLRDETAIQNVTLW